MGRGELKNIVLNPSLSLTHTKWDLCRDRHSHTDSHIQFHHNLSYYLIHFLWAKVHISDICIKLWSSVALVLFSISAVLHPHNMSAKTIKMTNVQMWMFVSSHDLDKRCLVIWPGSQCQNSSKICLMVLKSGLCTVCTKFNLPFLCGSRFVQWDIIMSSPNGCLNFKAKKTLKCN